MSAYIIGRITVTDPQDYAAYAEQTEALARKFGGRFLVKGCPWNCRLYLGRRGGRFCLGR